MRLSAFIDSLLSFDAAERLPLKTTYIYSSVNKGLRNTAHVQCTLLCVLTEQNNIDLWPEQKKNVCMENRIPINQKKNKWNVNTGIQAVAYANFKVIYRAYRSDPHTCMNNTSQLCLVYWHRRYVLLKHRPMVALWWVIWFFSHHHNNNVSTPLGAPSPWSPLTHDKHTMRRLECDEHMHLPEL